VACGSVYGYCSKLVSHKLAVAPTSLNEGRGERGVLGGSMRWCATVNDVGGNFLGGFDKGVWRACVRRSGVGWVVTWRATVCSCCPRLRLAHVGTHDEREATVGMVVWWSWGERDDSV